MALPAARTIGKQGFYSCDNLTSLYLPEAVLLGSQTFYGCPSLASLTLGANPPVLEGGALFSKDKPSEAIYVPSSALDAYMITETEGWTDALKEKLKSLAAL
jgi:hypothetical protein